MSVMRVCIRYLFDLICRASLQPLSQHMDPLVSRLACHKDLVLMQTLLSEEGFSASIFAAFWTTEAKAGAQTL